MEFDIADQDFQALKNFSTLQHTLRNWLALELLLKNFVRVCVTSSNVGLSRRRSQAKLTWI